MLDLRKGLKSALAEVHGGSFACFGPRAPDARLWPFWLVPRPDRTEYPTQSLLWISVQLLKKIEPPRRLDDDGSVDHFYHDFMAMTNCVFRRRKFGIIVDCC
jgi:hypothetical protein